MQISDLKPRQKARIVAIREEGDNAYRQRLIALGLLPGTEFEFLRKAPLGDPIAILVRGALLSLRQQEAHILQIEEVSS